MNSSPSNTGVSSREAAAASFLVRPGTTKRTLELVILISASLGIWWQPIVTTVKLALASDAHTHILLIVPIGLALIYMRTREGANASASRGWAGVLLLGVALLLRGFTAWPIEPISLSNNMSLGMCGLVLWWIGSVTICLGGRVVWSLFFPLCFLFLIVPMPERAVNWITECLQQQSAVASELLFHLVHVPVERHNVVLSLPTLDIEVARECSSIRSSTMLVVATLILGNLFLRSWWRQLLLAAISIPMGVLKNAVRIVTITELGTKDPSYFEGALHRHGGIVFFTFALLLVAAVLWLLSIGEVRTRR